MYYNYDKLLSFTTAVLLFVISERGVGKTFGSKVAMVKRFLKTGDQFIYVRRYKTELDSALNNFWTDIQENGYFDDLDLQVKRNKMITKFTCDGEVCGYAIPLSTSNILKSTAFPKVKTIIFDEFMLDNSGTYRYLKNEVTLMLDFIETIGRLRDIQVIFLGNNTSFYGNPYVAYFNLELPYNSEFKTFRDGLIVVNYVKNEAYRKAKRESKFGKLIDGTAYGNYAIDNESLRDNIHFIEKRPHDAKFYGMLIINSTSIGLWYAKNGYMYMSGDYDPNTLSKFVFDYNDHTENTIFTNARENMYLHMCVRAYKQGWLKFENLKIKSVAVQLLNRCISFQLCYNEDRIGYTICTFYRIIGKTTFRYFLLK